MTYSTIEGKFYPLQTQEYVRACRELTPAQKDVFYYLKTIAPFGDRCLEINVIELAEQLGRSKFTIGLAGLNWSQFFLEFVYGCANVPNATSAIASFSVVTFQAPHVLLSTK